MSTGDETELVRPGRRGPERATFLELFLDVVYVFALTRVSQQLVEDFAADSPAFLPDLGETTLLLLTLWLVWVFTSWVTSRYDPGHPAMQLAVFGSMFASFVMAVSVPDAFGGRGVAFAGAYVANQVGRPLVLALALRGHKRQAIPLRIFCWAAVSAVPWLTGAIFFQGGARGLVWALALALDYAGAMLGWPTPGLGRSRISNWEVAIKHLAERYQQLLIIALGESILLLGLTFTQNFAADRAAAFAMAFATTVLLWRIYFHRAGTVLADAIASAPEPGRLGQAVGYTHLVMVASILLTGVGYELVIEHPLGHPRPGWLTVILGGPALFLAARSRFEYDVFGRVSRSRIIALIALAALAPATISLPPLIATTAATAVLAAVATSDAIRARKGPPEAPSPPR